jgi:hypothetical protein
MKLLGGRPVKKKGRKPSSGATAFIKEARMSARPDPVVLFEDNLAGVSTD